MKPRQKRCVLALFSLFAGFLLLNAAGLPVHDITGEWQGAVAGQHLIVTITPAADGSFAGKFTAVDQGNVTLPFDAISFVPPSALTLVLKRADAVYEAKLTDDGSELVGTWHQGGNAVPLTLHRPGATVSRHPLKARTVGRIALEPCQTADGNTEALCGKYEVYENRSLQKGRRIALNIMVLPSLSDKPAGDPWFPLAGGPGQSAAKTYPLAGFTSKVRQQRDVVLVDQRGTGGSNALPCLLRDPSNVQAMIGETLSPETVRACRTELEKSADLTQYTTSIAADDLDDVRQAMGYDKINLFGASYGTLAAFVYLRRHGDHIRTLTLEGVAPPQYRIPLPFSRALQSSVDQLIARCAADEACNKDFPDLKKEFQGIVDRLEQSPAKFEVANNAGKTQSVTLSRGMFVASLRPLLYIPEIVSQFPYIIHQTYQGDWSLYAKLAPAIRAAIDKEVDRGMSLSVICSEAIPGMTEASIRSATAGTYLGDFQVRIYQRACHEWPRGEVPRDFYAPIRSKVPTLLISGALDPASPPEASAQAARDLSNSLVVVLKNGTHGTGSPCIDRLINDFVSLGSHKGLDVSCVNEIRLPPFVTQTH
jgi:pimeloyl-ACP methyl ester carboxylesterase